VLYICTKKYKNTIKEAIAFYKSNTIFSTAKTQKVVHFDFFLFAVVDINTPRLTYSKQKIFSSTVRRSKH